MNNKIKIYEYEIKKIIKKLLIEKMHLLIKLISTSIARHIGFPGGFDHGGGYILDHLGIKHAWNNVFRL